MSNKRNFIRSALSRQILLQYFLTLCAVGIGFTVVVALAWLVAHSFLWQSWDPLYQLLRWIKDNFVLTASACFLLLVLLVSFLFIHRSLRYLDDVIDASEKLAAPDDQEITLSSQLKTVQDEMNLIRQQALRNAFLAKEAEQRKNDLVVYLAHDLKTPLTSVIGYLTLLRDEGEISPQLRARYTGIALDKALRLEDLINEFFDITRFNFTSLVLQTQRVNFSRMLEQIVWEFRPILQEKGLEWETFLAPDIEIICDPGKMERVFDNLIRNAVSYSYPNSKIHLTLEASDDQVEIQVQNSGRTIPPEKLSKIFEQFYRLDPSRDSQTGGAGLGLAIAKEIVEQHGGNIQAQSEAESIRFLVRLPRNRHKIV